MRSCPCVAIDLLRCGGRAYAGGNQHRFCKGRGTHVPVDRRSLCLAVLAVVLAIAPAAAKETGLIFVSNEKSNNLIVIDPKTHKIIKDIKTSRRPRDMHFSADRSKLYVACGDDDVIDVIDMA